MKRRRLTIVYALSACNVGPHLRTKTVTMLVSSELYFWRNTSPNSCLNRSVLLAAWAARAVDGGAHVGTSERLDTARLHRAACGAALGALRMGVVTYVNPRERPAFVTTLGEVVGIHVCKDSHDQDGMEEKDRHKLGVLHGCF